MPERRRTYIVNKKYQYKYIALFVGVTALSAFVSAAYIVHDISRQIDSYMHRQVLGISRTGEIILPVVLRSSSSVSAALLIVVLLMSIYYFKRTSGLAAGLGGCISRFKSGELCGPAGMCGKDDFAEVGDAFNSMFDATARKVSALQVIAHGIDKDLDELEASVAAGTASEAMLEGLRVRLSEMDRALSGFKLR